MTSPDQPADALAKVIGIIQSATRFQFGYRIGASASLSADLELDAIDRVSMACALDEAFQIEVPDADVEAWETVSDVTATVARLAGLDPANLFPIEPGEAA